MHIQVLDRTLSAVIEVRRGIESDIEWLSQELKKFSEFFGSKIPLYDEQHVQRELPNWLANHVILVAVDKAWAYEDNEYAYLRLGFIGGLLVPHLLNPKIIQLAEVFWWVSEEHRGTSAGARLLAAYIQKAKVLGVDWLTMSLEENSPVREESLVKRGFRRTERSFLLELSDGSGLDNRSNRRGGGRSSICCGGSPTGAGGEESGVGSKEERPSAKRSGIGA